MGDRRSSRLDPGELNVFQERLRRAAEFVIAVRRKLGEEGDELRVDVLADVKDALVGDGPSVELIEVAGEPGPQVCITTEGVFREILDDFDLDRTDLRIQERFWEAARRAVDEVPAGQHGSWATLRSTIATGVQR